MSLAYRLLLGGYRGSVVVLERAVDFDREQRWCFWGPIDKDITPFVSKTWSKFLVAGGSLEFVRPAGAKYYQVSAPSFLNAIREKLSTANNFYLRMGVTVHKTTRDPANHVWNIGTDCGDVAAKLVFDARNLRGFTGSSDSAAPWLHQSFAGLTITTSKDVFDTDAVTLMDFRVPDGNEGAFIYVLPYSQNSALIESTLISVDREETDEHLTRVNWYIETKVKSSVTVHSTETGIIPMTTTKFPFSTTPGRYYIGILGGAAKPSTGYAFTRIQRHTKRIAAEMIKFGRPLSYRPSSTDQRREWIDDVFLTASAINKKFFTQTVLRMVDRLPPDLLIRFLSENDSLADDVKVMSVVGNRELADAAATLSGRRPQTGSVGD